MTDQSGVDFSITELRRASERGQRFIHRLLAWAADRIEYLEASRVTTARGVVTIRVDTAADAERLAIIIRTAFGGRAREVGDCPTTAPDAARARDFATVSGESGMPVYIPDPVRDATAIASKPLWLMPTQVWNGDDGRRTVVAVADDKDPAASTVTFLINGNQRATVSKKAFRRWMRDKNAVLGEG